MENQIERIDLHVHSTASDGTFTPIQILQVANDMNLTHLSITDHDTVMGGLEAINNKHLFNGELIPGIEINAKGFDMEKVEILGYYIDHTNPKLLELLEKMNDSRVQRQQLVLNKLANLGFKIELKDLDVSGKIGIVGRPHIGRAMVKLGYVKNVDEAFKIYLKEGGLGYVDRYKPSIEEIIEVIKAAKGVSTLAHPLISYPNLDDLENKVKQLIDLGLNGVELYYDYSKYRKNYNLTSKQVEKGQEILTKMSKEYDLVVTGGSDFHGDEGVLGGVKIPYGTIKKLNQHRKKIGK
ncbi:MAG: PHP domain-containing protein [Candidatus Heimdallarchaeota archaeon]|nr:PHP domain-containing protein [Candidatus Heimdallarchaeota archaeon]MCK5048149.1 PHP domain-containing protein [Candidatus Heimdallarchaeota archaeon]